MQKLTAKDQLKILHLLQDDLIKAISNLSTIKIQIKTIIENYGGFPVSDDFLEKEPEDIWQELRQFTTNFIESHYTQFNKSKS